MDKAKIKAYLTVAKKVYDIKDTINGNYIYTCNELQRIHPEAYGDYVDLYFNEQGTRLLNREDELWWDEEYLTERRLLMLCLAAAIEETGGLNA